MAGSDPAKQLIANPVVAAIEPFCHNSNSPVPTTANVIPVMNRMIVTTRTWRKDSIKVPRKFDAVTNTSDSPKQVVKPVCVSSRNKKYAN